MGLSMLVRIVIGLFLTAAALAIAGRRLWWLRRLAMSGQPAPERIAAVREHPGRAASGSPRSTHNPKLCSE